MVDSGGLGMVAMMSTHVNVCRARVSLGGVEIMNSLEDGIYRGTEPKLKLWGGDLNS